MFSGCSNCLKFFLILNENLLLIHFYLLVLILLSGPHGKIIVYCFISLEMAFILLPANILMPFEFLHLYSRMNPFKAQLSTEHCIWE